MDLQKRYTFTNNWADTHRGLWFKHFKSLSDQENHILEIGSYEGASTTWLLDELSNHPKSTVTAIDAFGLQLNDELRHKQQKSYKILQQHFKNNVRQSHNFSKLILIKKTSSDALRSMGKKCDGYFNFIYIDGSHAAGDVLRDAVYSWPLLDLGGFIVFDDYHLHMYLDPHDTPKPAIDGFLASYKPFLEIVHFGYQVIIQKKVRTDPVRVNKLSP